MNKVCCIILAAGEGKRMKSDEPKVLLQVLFKPMIKWVLDSVHNSGIDDVCLVSGCHREKLMEYIKSENENCKEAVQEEQKGTAHAVMMAADFLKEHEGFDVLVLNGDNPFIDADTIEKSLEEHRNNNSSATVITSVVDSPFGYGRVVRDNKTSQLKAIVEQKDLNEDQKKINEVNSGAFWFKVDDLLKVIFDIKNDNAQGEYYLPDTIKLFIQQGLKVLAYLTDNSDVSLGANDRLQLYKLNEIARNKILDDLIKSGVNIICKDAVIISPDTEIEPGSSVLPSTVIKGKSKIGSNCILGPNLFVSDCEIADNSVINNVCKIV